MEKSIQNHSLLAIGQRADVMVWRNQTGVFRAMDDPERVVKVGNPGAPDALGVVLVTVTPAMVGKQIGVAIAPEFKATKGRQSEQQKRWQAAFEARGGVYRIIRTPADMVQMVEDVRSGRW